VLLVLVSLAGPRLSAGEATPVDAPAETVVSGPLKFAEQLLARDYTYAYGVTVADFDVVACAERGANELRWWRNLGAASAKSNGD
jgi:hypothetical protein